MGALVYASLAAVAAAATDCGIGQRFLNFGQEPATQMWVSWASTDASSAQDATVSYGTSPAALGEAVTGESLTYAFGGAAYTSPYLHHALLTGLSSGTTYFYVVGGTCGNSSVANFTTAVNKSTPMRLAVFGDIGQTANSANTLAHIAANNEIAAIMHTGDLSYADSVETRWDSWQALIEPESSHIPWHVQVGKCVSGGEQQRDAGVALCDRAGVSRRA